MKLSGIIKTSFFLSLAGLVVNVYSVTNKIFGIEARMMMLLFPLLVFTVVAGYEVNMSKRILRSEKIMWMIGFVLTGLFAATAYMLSGRKRVISST